MLMQPFSTALKDSKRVLLAGAGGGYDLIGAVPLALDLLQEGKVVHLASLTFTNYRRLLNVRRYERLPQLVAVHGESATESCYCPEAWLARWFADRLDYREPIWLFDKTGVIPLLQAYQHLVRSLELDTVVVIDGGIDAVLRGDETSIGTPGEDLTTLCAVSKLALPVTLLACIGMGAELRDGISHSQFLARVSELTAIGAFLGSTSLTPLMESGRQYQDVLSFIFNHQHGLRQSHIQKLVVAAMQGQFGLQAQDVWLSPLLTFYWFFSLPVVASTHLFLTALESTQTAFEVSAIIKGARKSIRLQESTTIPI